jgi:hypothetical protein
MVKYGFLCFIQDLEPLKQKTADDALRMSETDFAKYKVISLQILFNAHNLFIIVMCFMHSLTNAWKSTNYMATFAHFSLFK